MSIRIQQPVGALFMKRLDSGDVLVSVQQGRDVARLELSQSELFDLYLELAVLLVEKPANG